MHDATDHLPHTFAPLKATAISKAKDTTPAFFGPQRHLLLYLIEPMANKQPIFIDFHLSPKTYRAIPFRHQTHGLWTTTVLIISQTTTRNLPFQPPKIPTSSFSSNLTDNPTTTPSSPQATLNQSP
jgi:hypothetical protein